MELYVGNYPSAFTENDLMFFFQDYDGIKILRFLKKDKKSYCFLKCKNEKQLEDVISATNGIEVYGRNLIVRAINNTVQVSSVNSSIRKESRIHQSNDKNSTGQFESQKTLANRSGKEEKMIPHYDDIKRSDSHQLFKNVSKSPVQNICPQETFLKHFPGNKSQVSLSDKFSLLMARNSPIKKDQAEYDYPYSNTTHHINDCEKQEDIGCSFDRMSSASGELEIKKEEISFVSVLNFPFHTTHEDLYELFEDFKPLKVWLVCNFPRPGRKATEAVITFYKSDATDAILTMDNSTYRKRSIIVCDAENVPCIHEILSLTKKKQSKFC